MGDSNIEAGLVRKGSSVTFHFTLKLAEQDKIAESTAEGEPMTLVVGEGDIIEGLERTLLGLQAGDKKTFAVPCMQAYGPAEEQLQHIPRSDFPAKIELEEGLVVGFETPSGDEIAGVVQVFNDDEVIIDFAHPLAGYDLVFDVEIISVE